LYFTVWSKFVQIFSDELLYDRSVYRKLITSSILVSHSTRKSWKKNVFNRNIGESGIKLKIT
jgi:hypothetical protein